MFDRTINVSNRGAKYLFIVKDRIFEDRLDLLNVEYEKGNDCDFTSVGLYLFKGNGGGTGTAFLG